ncbi:alpha/beta hydrolase [Roseovarius sp. CAU 1744]
MTPKQDAKRPILCNSWITGGGDPIVFVHGIGSSHNGWDGVVAGLGDTFRCITYDLRGHGVSPLPDGEFGLDELVEDLEALRADLGIERWHVAGHSLGGMIGPAYARRYPERTLSVALISTAAGRTEEDAAKVQGVVAAMEEKGIGEVLGTLANRWYTDAFIAANPEVVEARMRQVTGMSAEVFLNVFHIYAETEMAPWLQQVPVPCLVLTGELDGGCNPRLNRFIDAQLPDSRLVILDGLKHAILAEAPDQVARELRGFFLDVAQPAAAG